MNTKVRIGPNEIFEIARGKITKIIAAWRYCNLYSRKIVNIFSSHTQEIRKVSMVTLLNHTFVFSLETSLRTAQYYFEPF